VPSPEFDILEKLFFAVDDYVADTGLRHAVRGLAEDQLRDCAQTPTRGFTSAPIADLSVMSKFSGAKRVRVQ
jgi:hypothetical protein